LPEVNLMHPSLPQLRASRPSRWRLALLSGLAVVAMAGSALFVIPQSSVQAQQLPPGTPLSFADLVERVKGAVVSIQVTSQSPRITRNTPKGRDRLFPFDDEFFKRFQPDGILPPQQAQGSGFVVSTDGYVVTNNHVVAGATKVQVIFDQDNKYQADVVGTDERTDLALLKIKANGKTFPTVKFAKATPRVGEWVVAVGNPFGLGGTVTAGIVSAHGRNIGAGPYDFMQIDAAVNKGNSGGPTFNLAGEVVGVNTAIISPTGVSAGIAFAIPAKTANEVITQLKDSGSVKRGWLGVKIQSVDDGIAASLGLNEAKGAMIGEVQVPSPAADAGLKKGDLVVAVNGVKVTDSPHLAREIANYAPGTKVDVKVLRAQKDFGDRKEEVVSVTLGLLPTSQEVARPGPVPRPQQKSTELQQLGLSVAPVTGASREGVAVTEVDPGSDAAQKVRAGDVILEVNSNPVATPDDLSNAVNEATRLQRKAVMLLVRSGSETRFVAIELRRN
jgi:serine protease Do